MVFRGFVSRVLRVRAKELAVRRMALENREA